MHQETLLTVGTASAEAGLLLELSEIGESDRLIRDIRRASKRRRRLFAWLTPLIVAGIASTIFVFSHLDARLSLAVFGVSAAIVAFALSAEAGQWQRLATQASGLRDVRAIGPLLAVLNDRDSTASESIEEALIELLPCVQRLDQLPRNTRNELNRLLLEFEMPGLRGGHNAELAQSALELVARFRVCSALPAVRRLADGFTATRPSAAIRELASDILPDLEIRAALLRPSRADFDGLRSYLRPASGSGSEDGAELVRAADPEASGNAADYCEVHPPSIVSVEPVINAEAGEQR